jgi:hypothetical protein
MLFLLRPPQTRLPISIPRDPRGQAESNRLARESYGATRRVAPWQTVSGADRDIVGALRELASLRDAGALTDEEFSLAKARLLEQQDGAAP